MKRVLISPEDVDADELNDTLDSMEDTAISYSSFKQYDKARELIMSIPLHGGRLAALREGARRFQEKHEYPLEMKDELEALFPELAKINEVRVGVFVRLDTTSAKDGYFGLEPLRSAQDVVSAIVSSWRCWDDLSKSMSNTLWVFWYNSSMGWASEFRLFVYQGKVTAISQYDDCAMNQYDIPCGSELIETAKGVLENFKERVSYVVDVIWYPDNPKGDEGRVLEINEWGASACLFSWADPTDLDILFGRRKPEMRVLCKNE